ncbi:MAG: TonB-dependent receptor [Flavobacteriaceae bacterium]
MKKRIKLGCLSGTLKYDLKMKLTTLFLIFTLFQINANTYSQQTKVTLDMTQVSIENVLDKIESLTDFKFFVDTRKIDVKRKVTIKGKRERISKILKKLFSGTTVTYEIFNKQIILKKEDNKNEPLVAIPTLPLETDIVQQTLTGAVSDVNGISLPGANIVEKGTINGTQTDFDGNFSIEVADENAVLVISYIGYTTKEVMVNGQITLDIALSESAAGLEEVIVVGYGTRKKSDITGSVSSIRSSTIESRPITNIADVFQGNAAGVSVNSTGGSPGSDVQIRIRGIGSINSGVDPLYVVDGLPYDGALNSINAYDIKSIEILKDASSTAIYGSRGANGVVLITTKRGTNSKVQIDYNVASGLQQARKRISLLTGTPYAEYINEAFTNSGQAAPYSAADIASIHNNGIGTDWQDEFFRTAAIQTHQLSARGGSENVKFYLSANYLSQDGIIESSGFEKFSIRANLDVNLGKNFSMGNTLAISRQLTSEVEAHASGRNNEGNSNVVYSALVGDPTVPARDSNGNLTTETLIGINPGDFQNPLSLLNNLSETKINQTIGNIYLKYKITDWLSAKTTFGFSLTDQIRGSYINQAIIGSNGGRAARSTFQNTNWVSTNQLDFNKTIGHHDINAVVVAEAQKFTTERFTASSQTFVLDNLTFNALQSGSNPQIPESGASEWTLASYLARVNYSYKDKYLVTVSGRYDGASRLAVGNKWNLFPSGAVSWRISKEPFMENVNAIDELKIRLSYGESGSQSIGVYNTLGQLSADQAIIGVGQNINTGFAPQNFPNPALTWEISKQLNVGLDMSLNKGRLAFSADYFNRKTEGLFFGRGLPSVVGTNSLTTTTNIGSVENTGIEVEVNTTIVDSGDFTWNVSANFSYIKNKVLTLAENDTIVTGRGGPFGAGSGSQSLFVGGRLGTFRGWVKDGLYDNDVSLTLDGDTRSPGDIKYKDFNGDGDITIADRKFLGNAVPDKFWGFTSTFKYKNVSLSAFLQGSHGNKIVNFNRVIFLENLSGGGGNVSEVALDRWTPQNTDTNIPRASLTTQPLKFSDEWLEDGSYVRFKTITLGYTLPASLLDRLKAIRSFRIYATGTNLITFSNYSGYDPDVSSSGSVTQQGYDEAIYPSAKSIILGLNIGF